MINNFNFSFQPIDLRCLIPTKYGIIYIVDVFNGISGNQTKLKNIPKTQNNIKVMFLPAYLKN
jgi:hypothetical protein